MNPEAFPQTPDLLDTAPLPHAQERTLGHYRLQSLLGKGGMGEVYLAEDTHLERQVALKVLPAEFVADADRVRRFAREAKAASALNHPNILTIHEIGHEQNIHYIATEFIAGEPLRQHLSAARLPLNTALDIAAQIASALVVAHEAGIIHRDIKPENVMLRSDGLVKVLDFGLAKLLELRNADFGSRNEEAETLLQGEPNNPQSAISNPQSTIPGTVMGTASYMSPEQARGQDVDARSDIFSLGVLLYEMIAGRAPFAGVNALDVIGAILHQEPAPLTNYAADVPAELQRIVTKTLRKHRDERYQSAKDLLLDVKALQQELAFAARLKGERTTESDTTATIIQPTENSTRQVATARTISSAAIISGELKQHKKGIAIGAVVLLACLALLVYGVYRFATAKPAVIPFQNVRLTRLTSVGNVKGQVSISPDGKFIAYAQIDGGQNSLWTKAIATGSAVQIVPPSENELYSPVFSPNGDYVYYQRQEEKPTLYQVPVLGGTSKKILTEIYSQLTFSPDGNQFAFLRPNPDQKKAQLLMANADGSGERVLSERPLNDRLRSPAWSPDGKTIAVIVLSREGDIAKPLLLGIAVASGEAQPLVQPQHNLQAFNDVKWLRDGQGLALIATEKDSSNNQIWHVSYPAGEVRRITNDLANYPSLSLTADNSALIANQVEAYSNLWLMPLNASNRAQQITRGSNREGRQGVTWMPDGKLVYTAWASGKLDVWMMNADGSNARQITNDSAYDYKPLVTPDGRFVVFASLRSGKPNLWRIDLDGNNPKQLTTGELVPEFDLSPDGRWAVFVSREAEASRLFKVSLEGGSPVLIHDDFVSRPAISPDGKLIACLSTGGMRLAQPKVLIFSFEDGAPVKTLDINLATGSLAPLHWTPDGRALLYVDERQDGINLWRLPLDGNAPQPVTNFNDANPERIWNYDLSRDGRQLVIARGGQIADVVLMSEVK